MSQQNGTPKKLGAFTQGHIVRFLCAALGSAVDYKGDETAADLGRGQAVPWGQTAYILGTPRPHPLFLFADFGPFSLTDDPAWPKLAANWLSSLSDTQYKHSPRQYIRKCSTESPARGYLFTR